jgi:hypothetical protein
MGVRLSAPHIDRPLPPGRFLVLISVRGWVDPRAIVRLEGLGQLKNPMTSSGSHLFVLTGYLYSETSIHCFRRGSEKEMIGPGKQ